MKINLIPKDTRSTKHQAGFGHHFVLPLLAIVAVASIGAYLTFNSRAATTGETTFKLFAPGWRGLGGPDNASNIQYFKEIFGNMNPSTIPGKAPGTKVYNYTLGPYVVQSYVSCDLIPDANKLKNLSRCGKLALPDEALARGATSGLSVYAKTFQNNFLLVPDNPKTLAYVTSNAAEVVRFNKSTTNLYDGIFADSMGVAPVGTGYLNEKPRNPNTGNLYTRSEWLIAQGAMMEAKSAGLAPSGKSLIMNGLANGKTYFPPNPEESPKKLLTANVAGGMAERIFREPNAKSDDWRATTEANWLKDVEMIRSVQAMGKKGYWWTKCWSTSAYVDTVDGKKQFTESCKKETGDVDAKVRKVMRFALSSFLLGAGDKSYFNFDADKYEGAGKGNAAEFYPAYKTAFRLGLATQTDFTKSGAVYTRTFQNGVVIVNPTNAAAVYNLGTAKFRDLDGRRLTGSVDVPAYTGNIFLGSTGGSGGGTTGAPQDTSKARVSGFVDKDGVPLTSFRKSGKTALVRNYTVNVEWGKIQPSEGVFDTSSIDAAIAAADGLDAHVRLRVFAGRFSPDWAKAASGGGVSWQEPRDSATVPPYTMPRFWTSAYHEKYRDFLSKLSAKYDANPRVGEVTLSECMTTWAEPFIRQSGVVSNVNNALSAGYTYAGDKSCIRNNINLFDTRTGSTTAGRLFPTTRLTLAVNPFQGIKPPSGTNTLNDTLETAKYCRTVLGPRCVLGNNSVRSTSLGDAYNRIYSFEKAEGSPLYYQTAVGSRIGDYKKAIEFAIGQGAYSVEMSKADYAKYDKSVLADLLTKFKTD